MNQTKRSLRQSQSFRIKIKPKQAEVDIDHYTIGQKIGQGGFATVYKAIQKYTKAELAVKVISTDGLNQKQINCFLRQIEIQKSINHPNIVRIYEVIQKDSKFFIFMELAKGRQLFQHICEKGPIPEVNAVKIYYQICQAVKYLHDNCIVHRDIKAENIIIDHNFNAKLVDFGLAKKFSVPEQNLLVTICGSPSYISPQIMSKKKYVGQKVDIWCLGVTLYVILEAKLPFEGQNDKVRDQNIASFKWEKPNLSSTHAIEVYSKIFVKESERININQLLSLKFFDGCGFENSLLLQKRKFSNAQNKAKFCLIVQIITRWTKLPQEQVKRQILLKQLGLSFSLYNILIKQNVKKYKEFPIKQRRGTLQKIRNTITQERSRQSHRCKLRSNSRPTNIFMTPKKTDAERQLLKAHNKDLLKLESLNLIKANKGRQQHQKKSLILKLKNVQFETLQQKILNFQQQH